MKIRILLADDHKIMREGLRSMIEKQLDLEVVAEAEDGRTAVKLARELVPDLVVMDIAMPDLNGIEATRQIIAANPHIQVLALSMHSDKRFVVEALRAGVSGYLLKNCAFDELVLAIRKVMADQVYLGPKIADTMLRDYIRHLFQTDSTPFMDLTPREREVLQLLSEGKSTKEIAACLEVSAKTIETYRQQIMNKLNIRSIAELTKYAIREGITSLGA